LKENLLGIYTVPKTGITAKSLYQRHISVSRKGRFQAKTTGKQRQNKKNRKDFCGLDMK